MVKMLLVWFEEHSITKEFQSVFEVVGGVCDPFLEKEACALQRFFSLMNEESSRKSLVKGERFVRQDDTSEGGRAGACKVHTRFFTQMRFATIASSKLHGKIDDF